jgi:ribonucleoside-diphosphate reductase beta chain
MSIGLLTPQRAYKPVRYGWALEACRRQHQIHWIAETVPLGSDTQDWIKLTEAERQFLINVFRFFTQSDIEVNDCYMTKYAGIFQPNEVKMMLAAFSGMETIHILAYALLLETIGIPDDEFSAFLEIPSMMAKVNYMDTFGGTSPEDLLRTTAMFGGATEGLSLYGMFAMLLNFPRQGKMKGMGQIVSWSVRDESLHAASIIHLHNTLAHEMGGRSNRVNEDILETFAHQVKLEDAFVDTAFSFGPVPMVEPDEIKAYIRYVANWRLGQLKLPRLFAIDVHPLPWLQSMLSGVEHQNFFEGRSTGYSQGATRGKWEGPTGTWAEFDKLPKLSTEERLARHKTRES